jgi:hypothetical protein
MLFSQENEQPKKVEDITFTQKCILMSSISKDKSNILITSFYDIPLVRLYTAKINTKNLIYSKIKGALLFFCDKAVDKNSRKFYFRIYSIKNYTLLFNIELNKENLQYYIKVRENLYCLQTRQYLIGFRFNSKENAEKFYLQLRDEPNKDIVNQNEKAFNINPSKLNQDIYKDIIDAIKEELKKNNKKKATKAINSAKITNSTKNNQKILVNGTQGDYLDFSNLYFMHLLMNNVEYDSDDNKLNFFVNGTLSKKMCQDIINQFNKNNSSNFPMQIIDKDFNNILNKKKYIDFMANNIIKTISEQQALIIYKNANRKKQLKQKQLEIQNRSAEGRKSIQYRKVYTGRKSIEFRKNNSAEKRKVAGKNVNNSYNQRLSMEAREVKSPLKDEDINKNSKVNLKATLTMVKGKTNSVEKKKGASGFNLGGIFKKKK